MWGANENSIEVSLGEQETNGIHSAGWQQLVQSKWTWWMTRANFLNFVAISVAFSWEATALVGVTQEPGRGRQDGKESWQWCCWSHEINDVKKWEPLFADRSIMILFLLWLWVFLLQTCNFFWDGFTAQRKWLNRPVHPALVSRNGCYGDCATLNWFKSIKIREGKKKFQVTNQKSSIFWFKDIKRKYLPNHCTI